MIYELFDDKDEIFVQSVDQQLEAHLRETSSSLSLSLLQYSFIIKKMTKRTSDKRNIKHE